MYKVLIVDDEKLIRTGLGLLLDWEAHGFTICGSAANGEEALELIQELEPDVVLTDLKMPFMDGLELAHALAKEYPYIITVILTGFQDIQYIQEAMRASVFDYLLKPVKKEELANTLDRLYDKLETSSVIYPFEEEKLLLSAIRQYDIKTAKESFEEIISIVSAMRISPNQESRIYKKLFESVKNLHIEGNTADRYEERIYQADSVKGVLSEFRNYLEELSKKHATSADILVEQIKDYLRKHYSEDITLETLSEVFYMNPSYISRVFKRQGNENYRAYLLSVRVERAKELLAESSMSVTQISDVCGFGNQAYFSRVFKEATGMSPVEYRHEEQK